MGGYAMERWCPHCEIRSEVMGKVRASGVKPSCLYRKPTAGDVVTYAFG